MKRPTLNTAIRLLSCAAVASLALTTACKKQDAKSHNHGQTQPVAPNVWTSSQAAAADSVEGQLRAQGKQWKKGTGEIAVGAYVQDTLEGRLNQPEGRGAIGKIVSMSPGAGGASAAVVDFGRNYKVPINLSELSLVNVE
jgi:hypothetical protein